MQHEKHKNNKQAEYCIILLHHQIATKLGVCKLKSINLIVSRIANSFDKQFFQIQK